jgi:hypothetical protein
MLNPLNSEAEAFRFLLWVGGIVAAITVLIVILRALL